MILLSCFNKKLFSFLASACPDLNLMLLSKGLYVSFQSAEKKNDAVLFIIIIIIVKIDQDRAAFCSRSYHACTYCIATITNCIPLLFKNLL